MRTPPGSLSPTYTPKIEVTHPNVPDSGSREQLVNNRTSSPPYHGQDNPVFTFDKETLFRRAPSPVDPINIPPYSESPALRSLPPLRRGSYSPFLPATDKDSLTVPAFGVRRQSLSSTWGRGDNSMALLASPKKRLKPVLSLSIDNVTSDLRAQAAPSPGLLSTRSMWSTSDLMATPAPHDLDTASKSSSELLSIPASSFCTSSLSNVSGSLGERMHELVRAFSSRTQRCKERISQPPTPSSTSSYDAKSAISGAEEPPAQRTHRLGSFLPAVSTTSELSEAPPRFLSFGCCRVPLPRCCTHLSRLTNTMESYSKVYVSWLFVVTIAYMYNSTVIPLRGVFPYQTEGNWRYWLVADYLSDAVYLLDILLFKTRLRFTDNGIVETDFHQTKKHYLNKWIFKLDLLSLLPLDIFYFTTDQPWARKFVWLRLPRMLKIQTFWEFYARCDQAAKSSAHAIRIIKTMTYMLYLIHVETCGYYAVSEYEGLSSNRWVYNNEGNAYIRCFYLATKTATSIGNNPKPTNTLEYMFMTLYWLSGVFVFALLIGQIRDIVEAAAHVKTSYRKKMDGVLHYMQTINISDNTQDRARKWFLYNWEQSKTIDERSLVAALPKKLQTDLAINVHFNTLIKVQLFQDCERNLLYDLVLKLKPNLFLPGDYVCQKGEVGKEMYIVSQGQVEVVGGEKKDVVLATLSEGSVFGEISLLAMSGRGNRRTADVRSSGYTNVFTLSKHDFEEAMNEYPEAQKLLKKRAKKLLKENAKKMEKKTPKVEAEEIIKTPHDTPKMVKTVIQVLNPESETAQKLTYARKHLSGTNSRAQHLTVPGPTPMPKGPRIPRQHELAQNNLAFDLSDEKTQIKPSIITQYYHDDYIDDLLDNNDDEFIVIERTEHSLPPTHDDQKEEEEEEDDVLLNDDDVDANDNGDLTEEQFMDAVPFLKEDTSFEQEFFNNVMNELRAQEVICAPEDEETAPQDNDVAPQKKNTAHQTENSTLLDENIAAREENSAARDENTVVARDEMFAARDENTAVSRDENSVAHDENIATRVEKTQERTNESDDARKTSDERKRGRNPNGKKGGKGKKTKANEGTSQSRPKDTTKYAKLTQEKDITKSSKTAPENEGAGQHHSKKDTEKEKSPNKKIEGETPGKEETDKERGGGERDGKRKERETEAETPSVVLIRVQETETPKSVDSERTTVQETTTSRHRPADLDGKNDHHQQQHDHHHHRHQQQQAEEKERRQKKKEGEEREEDIHELPQPSVSQLITVGIGGISGQEMSVLPTNRRLRKISTVSQPHLSTTDDAPATMANPTTTTTTTATVNHPRYHHHHHTPIHPTPITPIEACGGGDSVLAGMAAAAAAAASTNQVTCSAEIHREKSLTPTTSMTPGMTLTSLPMTETATSCLTSVPMTDTVTSATPAAEKSSSSARNSSVSTPTSALASELAQLDCETVV